MNEKQIMRLIEQRVGELILEKSNFRGKSKSAIGRAISELQFILMTIMYKNKKYGKKNTRNNN